MEEMFIYISPAYYDVQQIRPDIEFSVFYLYSKVNLAVKRPQLGLLIRRVCGEEACTRYRRTVSQYVCP